ncbi:MAG: hypothetical protein HYX61_02965 [Gammaproteobacteria bacterium]|jgi:hypothetical protein|nr:hypothetical protein [Gammaproteobacteria bacterium]
MITPKQKRMVQNFKRVLSTDVSNGFPDEFTYKQICRLLMNHYNRDDFLAIASALEHATLNKEINARRAGYHEYDYPRGSGKPQNPLEPDEILALELEAINILLLSKTEKQNRNQKYQNKQLQTLYEIAPLAIGKQFLEMTKNLDPIFQNLLQINWYYKAKDLKEWLEQVDEEPGELLQSWFSEKCFVEDKANEGGDLQETSSLSFEKFMPGFPKKQEPGIKAIVIRAAVKEFISKNKRYPAKEEIWVQLEKTPPSIYTTKVTKHNGEKAIIINGTSTLGLGAFRKAWGRYTFPKLDKVADKVDEVDDHLTELF